MLCFICKRFKLWYNKYMKTCIITGASGDIGREIAKTMHEAGYSLILLYHKNAKGVKKLENELKGSNMSIYQCDLTDNVAIDSLMKEIKKNFKKIDCLINNAGVSLFKQIQDTTLSDYNYIFDTNLKSAIFMIKYISKMMISEQYGRIINISSMWGNVGASMESLYSASKGAINTLTKSLAKELGPSNITVNAICPGLIDTKMNKNIAPEIKQEIIDATPLSRIGSAKDVANLVDFLASDKASFITGQIINVDGGFSI